MEELDKLVAYAKTKYPCVMVVGQEPDRVVANLYELTKGENGNGLKTQSGKTWQICTWDIRRKFRLEGHGELPNMVLPAKEDFTAPRHELDAITLMASAQPFRIYCLYNYHYFLDDPEVLQEIQNNLNLFKTKSIMLVFLVPEEKIPVVLERDIEVIDWPLPTKDEIRKKLEQAEKANGVKASKPEEAVDAAQGMTTKQIEDAYAMAYFKSNGADFDPKTILELKAQMVRKTAGLHIKKYSETFDRIIGLDLLKEFLMNRITVWQLNRLLPLKGVIITGYPGNAKSVIARAFGNAVNWLTVTANVTEVIDKYVGESPRKFREMWKRVRAMAPCIFFIDEFDKAFGGVGKDSSTAVYDEIGQIMLQELDMFNPDAPVFTICTSNNISALPTEYIRLGRFDGIFFVENPSPTEARQILDMYLHDFTGKGIDQHFKLTAELRDYSGAELRQVALETAYNGGDLPTAVGFVQPIARVRHGHYKEMKRTALESAARPASKHQIQAFTEGVRKVEIN